MANERKILRCAVYTRKSSEHGLEQDFNSLDAQREAAEAYVKSQAHCRCNREEMCDIRDCRLLADLTAVTL